MTCITYTENIMKNVLINFKNNNGIENVFFNLSYYSQRDPPKYFKSKYDNESLKVRINGRERMIITSLKKIIEFHTKKNNFLIIHIFRCRDVNDKYTIEYSFSTIPIAN
jgi:hypothetical protein